MATTRDRVADREVGGGSMNWDSFDTLKHTACHPCWRLVLETSRRAGDGGRSARKGDVQPVSPSRIHFGTTCCFFDGSSWNGLSRKKHVQFSKFLGSFWAPRSAPYYNIRNKQTGSSGTEDNLFFFWHSRSKITIPAREKHQEERNTHSPLVNTTLTLPFPTTLSRPGRFSPTGRPPLSLLLASRVVGPVVEQGVHGVFFFSSIVKGENNGVYGGFQRLRHA